MSKIPDVPSTENVPDGPLAWLKNWLDQVRLWVQTRDPRATRVGDPLDKFTDRRELVDLGILRRSSDGTFRPGNGFGNGATIVIPGGGTGGGGPDFSDLTPPPAPEGLTAEGGIFTLQLAWDAPTYTQGRGNGQTNIYGAVWLPGTSRPTLGDPRTKRIDSAMEASNLHSYPTQPATRWVVWIKFQTRNGVEGPPSLSAEATTGQDVTALLTILTGQIRESELYAALAEPIRSIIRRADDAAEDTLRAALATHQESRRAAAALLAEAAARGTAITQVRTLVNEGDAQLASQITTLTATVSGNRTEALAAIELEETARADGDSAEATQRSLLATQMRGGYTGTDLDALTSGLLYSERQVRSTQTGALATRVDGLEASVDTPGTGLLARATALETVTTDVSSGNSALASRANSLEATVNNPSTGVAATAAALDVVETLVNDGTTGVTALTSRTTTLEASVNTPTTGNNPTYAALQTEASARAALDGAVHALYTVRAEVSSGGRTVVGGFGLAATATASAGPRIDFGVRADTFFVEAPSGGGNPTTKLTPFIIRTSDSTEGGVSVPAGVYMDAAYIVNLTAMYARIASLVADSISAASINVSQLVAGSLAVGAYAQSTGFVSGTSGWRISGNGVAEFSGVVARGTIIATAGSIGGNAIDSTGMQSPGYTAGSTGWRLDTTGLVRAFASAGARVLDLAATGTQPVLKIGTALELLANGDAFFGGRLAVGSVTSAATVATGVTSIYIGAGVSIATGTYAVTTFVKAAGTLVLTANIATLVVTSGTTNCAFRHEAVIRINGLAAGFTNSSSIRIPGRNQYATGCIALVLLNADYPAGTYNITCEVVVDAFDVAAGNPASILTNVSSSVSFGVVESKV